MNDADPTLEGLVHDLNNVFQTISESADVLASDPVWERVSATLRRSVERGRRIAQSIVDTNRTGAPLELVARDAAEFASDYLESLHAPPLRIHVEADPEVRVNGAPGQWERVLANLFLNAAEAGARSVVVAAHDGEILIRDDGPGIPPELLGRLFQPHVSTKSILSGLGLYVVRSLVEQNGGEVTARNAPGGGAEFRIVMQVPQAR